MPLIRNSLRTSTCPCCGSRAVGLVGPVDYGASVRFSSHSVELEFLPELWRCTDCGSAFVQNAIPHAVAVDLYSTGASGERWKRPPFREIHTGIVLGELRSLFRPGVRVLDVGGNTGELLDFARGYGCQTAAVEYSRESREVLAEKGHAAHASAAAAGGGYDVVTAFDLVEHLYDLPTSLRECREALAPGGLLVILTGDICSFSARLARSRWWYCSYPEHIVFPSRRFFQARSGFEPIRFRSTYASRGYVPGLLAKAYAVKLLVAGSYGGLPAIGPDHMLAILRRPS